MCAEAASAAAAAAAAAALAAAALKMLLAMSLAAWCLPSQSLLSCEHVDNRSPSCPRGPRWTQPLPCLHPYRAPRKPMLEIASRRTRGEGMIHRHACYAIITRTPKEPVHGGRRAPRICTTCIRDDGRLIPHTRVQVWYTARTPPTWNTARSETYQVQTVHNTRAGKHPHPPL